MADTSVVRPSALSISIVTYRIDKLAFCKVLENLYNAISCLAGRESGPVQITIIDNGNQQELLEDIARNRAADIAHIEIVGGLNNIGYGRAHNLAILTTRAPYHLILNPDVLLSEDCLVAGLDYLRQHQKISAVAPFATDAEGNVQYLCKNFPSVLDLLLRGFAPETLKRYFQTRLSRYELRNVITNQAVEGVPLISGCFMLCNSNMLKQAGGFDERFFLYFEDFALSMELKKQGPLAFLPQMKIRHFGGNSARKGIKHIGMFINSGIKFFNTYGWKII